MPKKWSSDVIIQKCLLFQATACWHSNFVESALLPTLLGNRAQAVQATYGQFWKSVQFNYSTILQQ